MIQHSQAADLKLPALNAAAPSPVSMDPQLADVILGKPLDHPRVDPTVRVTKTHLFWK